MLFVPVVDRQNQPLMPTTPARARRWMRYGKATPFWKGGIFCVRLNQEPSAQQTQLIAVGIDPGSKKEAVVVKSAAHTYFNIQADAVTWVKEAVQAVIKCAGLGASETRHAVHLVSTGHEGACRPPPRRAGSGNCASASG